METKHKHSPLPYRVEVDCNEDGEHDAPPIYVVSDQTVCDLTVVATIGSHSGTHEQKLATAHLIVRACNNHYKLVEALKYARAACETVFSPGAQVFSEIDKALAEAEAA